MKMICKWLPNLHSYGTDYIKVQAVRVEDLLLCDINDCHWTDKLWRKSHFIACCWHIYYISKTCIHVFTKLTLPTVNVYICFYKTYICLLLTYIFSSHIYMSSQNLCSQLLKYMYIFKTYICMTLLNLHMWTYIHIYKILWNVDSYNLCYKPRLLLFPIFRQQCYNNAAVKFSPASAQD